MGVACADPFDPDELFDEVSSAAPYADLTREQFDRVVDFVCTGGYALRRYDRYHRMVQTADGRYRVANPRVAQQYRMSSISDNKLDRIWAANVKGNIQLCNLFTPLVERSDAGSIVIVSSISALTGSNNIGAYAMAKAALLQFVRNLAIDLGPQKIRVNALSPGLTRTDLGSVALGLPAGQRLVERTPLCRVAEPEDVAGAAVFLASNDARFITGQNIIIDGGISIADYA